MSAAAPYGRAGGLARRLLSNRLLGQVGWVTATFGVNQLMRLGSNIILAWLLTPAIFGVLTLVNTARTGIELITDVGVGQNIVVAKQGDDPAFISTAWTVQVIRGVALFAVGLLVAWPLSRAYDDPQLFPIFATVSVIFLLTGVAAPARFLMQRRRETKRAALYDLALAIASTAITLAFALLSPTVWSMIWAMIAYSAVAAFSQFFMMDRRVLSLRIDPASAGQILRFGKWIFVSSLIYFAATNFDRLYLPAHIPLALFGVYGIARTIGDAVTSLMQRFGSLIIFPAVARFRDDLGDRVARIARVRRLGLAALTVGIAGGVAGGDLFVALAYDDRYATAQVMVPLLLAGTWFSVQATMAEAILLGLSAPARAAAGNAARLGWMVALLPLAFGWSGLVAGFAVIAFADLPRYLTLAWSQHRAGLSFWRQDLGVLALGAGCVALFRGALVAAGLVDGFLSTAQRAALAALG